MFSFNFRFSFSFIFFISALLLFFTQSTFARQNNNFDCQGLTNSANSKHRKQIKKCIENDSQTIYLNKQYLQKFSKVSQFWSQEQKEIAKKQTFMKLNNNFNNCLKNLKNQQNLVSVADVRICWQNSYKKHIQFMENDFNIKK